MCIVFFKYRMDDRFPIMLAANREENLLRPTLPPCTMDGISCAGVDCGPKGDSKQIGTWLGVNHEANMLVAVTNRDDGYLAGTKSRGVLCHDLLHLSSVNEVLKGLLRLLDAEQQYFSGANFIILSPKSGYVVHAPNNKKVNVKPIHQGVHAITNLNLNDPQDERIKFVKANLKAGNPDHFLDAAHFLCAHNHVVINDPEWGTVSSAIVRMSDTEFDMHVSHSLPTSSKSYERYLTRTGVPPTFVHG